MAKYQLSVNMAGGSLLVGFDSVTDLEEQLKTLDVNALQKAIATHLESITKIEPRKVKPGLDGICQFRSDGSLEFLIPAASKIDAIGIILYAYDPDPVAVDRIAVMSADKNPAAYMLQKKYANLFQRNKAGLYGLTHDGRTWVASTVIPGLRKDS